MGFVASEVMLETKAPREQNGRDSFSRYRAQVRSAALAALSILEGKEIDRIYCDLHDDFVVRKKNDRGYGYIFYQVKTHGKQNHNWSLNELFGIKSSSRNQDKQNTEDIKNSFIGKLLLHTAVFDEYCNMVVFQTNINNADDVEDVLDDITGGVFENKFVKVLIDRFNQCLPSELACNLTEKEIKLRLLKLRFETDTQHLKENNNNFESEARSKIFEFSEIDLGYIESREILMKLLALVENKSSGVIKNLNKESIENLSGISINDLLSILSISKEAYKSLVMGGDTKAIKNASIIQRVLTAAGAGKDQIEYCSRCKVMWDLWLRNNRHMLKELDLSFIISKIQNLLKSARQDRDSISLHTLRKPIISLIKELEDEKLKYDLTEDHILGGFFSELVRRAS